MDQCLPSGCSRDKTVDLSSGIRLTRPPAARTLAKLGGLELFIGQFPGCLKPMHFAVPAKRETGLCPDSDVGNTERHCRK